MFSFWEFAGEGEINNSVQWPCSTEHGFHTETRLRIVTTSLESVQCPRLSFPTENHFCLLLATKTHTLTATLHILLRSVVTLLCHYPFSRIWPACQNSCGSKQYFVHVQPLTAPSHGWRASFWVKSWLICSVLKIIDELPTLTQELLVLHKANRRNNVTPYLKFNVFCSLLSEAVPLWICWRFKFGFGNFLSISNTCSAQNFIQSYPLHTLPMWKFFLSFFLKAF